MTFPGEIMWSTVAVLVVSVLASVQAVDNGNNKTFVLNFCSCNSGDAHGFVALEPAHASVWPRDRFCQALADGAPTKGNYNMSLQLFNDVGYTGVNSGNPGISFNVKNSINFDFVYIRLHSTRRCYQTGYVKDGDLHLNMTSSCPSGPPKGRKWFTVHLRVVDRQTSLFLDGGHVTTFYHHHDNIARGGAVVRNGNMNRVFFRGYNVTQTPKQQS